jgi:hypothetical protein
MEHARQATPQAALALFDRLPAVEPRELLGRWRGESFASGHPLDGVLEAYHWHGKEFHSPEQVDPLLFETAAGSVVPLRAVVMPDPRWLERWPWLRSRTAGQLFQHLLLPWLRCAAPQARVRRLEHRGVSSAAMVYDRLAIIDVFRRLDEERLLGLMDARGMEPPFFFVLRSERNGTRREAEVETGSFRPTPGAVAPGLREPLPAEKPGLQQGEVSRTDASAFTTALLKQQAMGGLAQGVGQLDQFFQPDFIAPE